MLASFPAIYEGSILGVAKHGVATCEANKAVVGLSQQLTTGGGQVTTTETDGVDEQTRGLNFRPVFIKRERMSPPLPYTPLEPAIRDITARVTNESRTAAPATQRVRRPMQPAPTAGPGRPRQASNAVWGLWKEVLV